MWNVSDALISASERSAQQVTSRVALNRCPSSLVTFELHRDRAGRAVAHVLRAGDEDQTRVLRRAVAQLLVGRARRSDG
jgi:hypothetical protein